MVPAKIEYAPLLNQVTPKLKTTTTLPALERYPKDRKEAKGFGIHSRTACKQVLNQTLTPFCVGQ